MTTTTQAILDGRGKAITTYVVFDADRRLETMAHGETLAIRTDDYEPFWSDIAAWCRATGHELVETTAAADGLTFLVRKGSRPAKATQLAMVISSDGLEELLSPLGFALAAALEGIEAHLFLQGPAVRVMKRGYRPKLRGAMRPFSRFAAKSMAKGGHIGPQDKLAQLRTLGAQIYMCGPSMDHFKVAAEDLVTDEVAVVEYLTFMEVMEQSDIHLYL